MNLWAVFLTGLFAGGASCAAVQGGLLAGVVARRPQLTGGAALAGKRPPASRATPSNDRRRTGSAGALGKRSPSQGRARATTAPAPSRAADLVPVGWFLGGKLVSHTALGALLGLLGEAVQLSFRTRAALQIVAGVVMVILALNLYGVAGLSRLVPQPPPALARLVRRRARSSGAARPALVGMATVLIPCGVTFSVEVLAITSGSPLAGAAILGVFVVGTSPLFAVLGYAARRSATALRGRLGKLAAVAMLVMGLISVNTGLVLAGSPFTASTAVAVVRGPVSDSDSVAAGDAAASLPPAAVIRDGVQEVRILALDAAYVPNIQQARAGVPTKLIIETRNTRGCTRSFVIPSAGVESVLPQDGETVVDVGVLAPGRLDYTCGMGMYRGAIEVI